VLSSRLLVSCDSWTCRSDSIPSFISHTYIVLVLPFLVTSQDIRTDIIGHVIVTVLVGDCSILQFSLASEKAVTDEGGLPSRRGPRTWPLYVEEGKARQTCCAIVCTMIYTVLTIIHFSTFNVHLLHRNSAEGEYTVGK
jgi:hypothetical protein